MPATFFLTATFPIENFRYNPGFDYPVCCLYGSFLMKSSHFLLTASSLFCMLNSQLHAEEKQVYVGAKYGQYDFNLERMAAVDQGQGFAIFGNLDLSKGLALEFEYGDSGNADFEYDGSTIKGGEIRLQHIGAYGVYRTPGTFYGKVKLGVSVNHLDATNLNCPYGFCTDTISKDDGATVYGLGAGLNFAKQFRAELEYTALDSDVDSFQLGILFGL